MASGVQSAVIIVIFYQEVCMKKILFFAVWSVLLMVLAFPAFSQAAQEEFIEEEPAEEEEEFLKTVTYDGDWEIGRQGGELVRAVLGEPKTFNEAVAAETSTTDITHQLYDAPIDRNQFTLEFEPVMAESYEIADDGKSVTVKMRKNLKWSDGEPLTAEDVVFAANEIFLNEDVESNYRSGLIVDGKPAKFELIDEYTYKVSLHTEYAGLLTIAGNTPMPKHIFKPLIEEEGAAAINSFWGVDTDVTEVVGCGPFVIDEYAPGQRIVLKRNPYYWQKDAEGNQLPYLDKVTYVIVEDQDTQLARFLAGELDLLGLRGEDYTVVSEKLDELNATIYDIGPVASTQFLTFNMNPDAEVDDEGNEIPGTTKPERYYWTSNKQFRLAMAHLIDRETIINNIAYGFGYPQYSFIPRFSPYYWEGVEDAAPKFDPDKAAEILDDLGWVDTDGDGTREDDKGRPITLELTTNSGNTVREAIGNLVAQEAAKVGISINFKPEDFNTMVGKLLSGQNWDLIIIGLTGSVDPISGANVYPSSGNLHMNNPNQEEPYTEWEKEVDEAWSYANNTTDENQRKEGFKKIQQLWIEYNPWVYTFNQTSLQAYKNKFGNVYPRPIDGFNWDGILYRLYVK